MLMFIFKTTDIKHIENILNKNKEYFNFERNCPPPIIIDVLTKMLDKDIKNNKICYIEKEFSKYKHFLESYKSAFLKNNNLFIESFDSALKVLMVLKSSVNNDFGYCFKIVLGLSFHEEWDEVDATINTLGSHKKELFIYTNDLIILPIPV